MSNYFATLIIASFFVLLSLQNITFTETLSKFPNEN